MYTTFLDIIFTSMDNLYKSVCVTQLPCMSHTHLYWWCLFIHYMLFFSPKKKNYPHRSAVVGQTGWLKLASIGDSCCFCVCLTLRNLLYCWVMLPLLVLLGLGVLKVIHQKLSFWRATQVLPSWEHAWIFVMGGCPLSKMSWIIGKVVRIFLPVDFQ